MGKSFTYGIAVAKVRTLGEGATFYASDLGLCGGTVNGLQCNGVIEKTGKTRECFVNVYDNHFIKSEVYEWRVRNTDSDSDWRKKYNEREFTKFVNAILETAEMLKSLGFGNCD